MVLEASFGHVERVILELLKFIWQCGFNSNVLKYGWEMSRYEFIRDLHAHVSKVKSCMFNN